MTNVNKLPDYVASQINLVLYTASCHEAAIDSLLERGRISDALYAERLAKQAYRRAQMIEEAYWVKRAAREV